MRKAKQDKQLRKVSLVRLPRIRFQLSEVKIVRLDSNLNRIYQIAN